MLAMAAVRQRFQRLSKQFEALVRDLNDSQDAEQRKEYLRRMSVILNQVDELILKQYPRQDSERTALSCSRTSDDSVSAIEATEPR
jgi:hypothetical protein